MRVIWKLCTISNFTAFYVWSYAPLICWKIYLFRFPVINLRSLKQIFSNWYTRSGTIESRPSSSVFMSHIKQIKSPSIKTFHNNISEREKIGPFLSETDCMLHLFYIRFLLFQNCYQLTNKILQKKKWVYLLQLYVSVLYWCTQFTI